MKQSVLCILLLGFGLTTPFTCSQRKKESTKQQSQKEDKKPEHKQMTLGGPYVKIIVASKSV
jgi:hypothetical protein